MPFLRTKLAAWIGERYPLEQIGGFLRAQAEKRIPPQTSWWHTLGSLLLFLTANQIVTGVLLMVYYRPAPETAFESVVHLSTRTHFGWLIRGLHVWGAHAMILLVGAHMLRTFLTGAFKKPRELTWLTGVSLMGVVLGFGFTGYLLPWSQLSYWGTTVGTEILGVIPLVGEAARTLLRGGETVGGETLSRFYVVHVAVLPWVLVVLVAVHVLLVRVHGITPLEPVGRETWQTGPRIVRFWPDHVAKDSLVVALFVALLVGLVFAAPPELGERADPLRSPEGIKPEWYFLPTYQLLKYFPKVLGLFVSVVPLILLVAWPFLDRTRERHPRKRPWSVLLACSAVLLAILLGLLGHYSERTVTLFGVPVRFDMLGVPQRLEPLEGSAAESLQKPPDIGIEAAVEDGARMLIASVSREAKPVEGARVEFFVEVEGQDQALGQDTTIDDGTAAVAFPEGVPGGPRGELRIRAEVRESEAGPPARASGVFLGGIPVPAIHWQPASLWSIVGASGTVLAGIATAVLMNLLARRERRRRQG